SRVSRAAWTCVRSVASNSPGVKCASAHASGCRVPAWARWCTPPERLVDERLPEAAIGACHQDGPGCEGCGFMGSFVLRLNRLAVTLVETPSRPRTDRFVWRQAGVSRSDAS